MKLPPPALPEITGNYTVTTYTTKSIIFNHFHYYDYYMVSVPSFRSFMQWHSYHDHDVSMGWKQYVGSHKIVPICSQQCCWGHVVMLALCRDLEMLHSEYWKVCLKKLTCSWFFSWRQMQAVLSPGITWQEEDCSSWTGFTRRHMHRATLVLVFLQASRQYKTCLRVWTILIHLIHPCFPPSDSQAEKLWRSKLEALRLIEPCPLIYNH